LSTNDIRGVILIDKNNNLRDFVLRELSEGGVKVKRVPKNEVSSAFVGNRLKKLEIRYPSDVKK
jgi:hypothetical protein